MNTRQARRIRQGIVYARYVQGLLAAFGPHAQLETLRQFKPKNKLTRRTYEMTNRGAAYRRAERLVRGKSRRVYLRRHGLSV